MPRPANLYRTCPFCNEPMGFSEATTDTQDDFESDPSTYTTLVWECPQCGLHDDLGADVQARIEDRPRLFD